MYLSERYISDADADEIKNIVDGIAKDSPSPEWYSSTIGGDDFHLMPRQEELDDIIDHYEHILGRELQLLNAWSVYGDEGNFHLVHRHHKFPKYICTVLFLDTEGVQSPHGDFYAVLNNNVYQFSPQKGDLLIFSSDVCHGTYPQVKGLRQTLNMDFRNLGQRNVSRKV